jgi:hypothetical protein
VSPVPTTSTSASAGSEAIAPGASGSTRRPPRAARSSPAGNTGGPCPTASTTSRAASVAPSSSAIRKPVAIGSTSRAPATIRTISASAEASASPKRAAT